MSTLEQKVDAELKDAHVGWRLEGVKHAYPQPTSASKTRTLNPKSRPPDPGGRQKRVPSAKKCVKSAYLRQKVRQIRVPSAREPAPTTRRASTTRTLSPQVHQQQVPCYSFHSPIMLGLRFLMHGFSYPMHFLTNGVTFSAHHSEPRDGNEPLKAPLSFE